MVFLAIINILTCASVNPSSPPFRLILWYLTLGLVLCIIEFNQNQNQSCFLISFNTSFNFNIQHFFLEHAAIFVYLASFLTLYLTSLVLSNALHSRNNHQTFVYHPFKKIRFKHGGGKSGNMWISIIIKDFSKSI